TIKTICREGSESELSAAACQDINDCLAVTNLSAGSITDSSAVISWTRGTETSWNLKVNDDTPVALTETTEGVTVNGDVISYALTGLEQNTDYTVAIQSNCDGTLSQNLVSVEFTTERTPAALPYVYGFEDAVENANWVFANGTYTNKWYIGSAVNHGGANALYISNDNGENNVYGTSASYVYAYREINFASAGDYIISFDWRAKGENSYGAWDAMYAALVPHGTACPPASNITSSTNSLPTGYINVADVSQSYINTGAFLWTYTDSYWQTSTMTIPISTPGVYTLVFYWKNDGSGVYDPPAAVDNINIRALTCPAVDNLAVATSGITNNSAVITWTEHGTAEAWEVIVSATEVTDFDAATKVPVTAVTYTATGLHAETTYHVYVRANCAIDDNSDWAHTIFTTLISCPAPEDLTAPALTITNNSAVITWTERGDAENWEVIVSATEVTDFASATAIPVTEATYSATGLNAETTYHVYVRANCDVDDNSQWTHATFTTVASCPVPDGLATSAITGNSATITWNGYTASNWTLEYATSSSFTGATSVTVNDNPTADLTGLAAQTTYYVRVKAVCEDDAESAYSSTLSFTTTCAAIAEFPWNEGFENGIDCWTLVDGDADGYEWYEINLPQANQDNLLSTHGGSYMMTSASWVPYTALTPNNWLISPGLDLTALSGTVKLSYFVGGHQTEWPSEHYKVCVSTSTDTASFTTILFEETIPTSGWLERYVDLSSYVGQTIYIAFVHYNCTDMFRLDLDDISVYVDTSTDAAITGITAPTHGNYSTCALTDAEQIKVNIINNGGAAISDFEVSYSINGGTPVTETVTASIAPAQTYEYTFAQTADLSLIGDYTITASVNLTGDETADNDTASMTITSGDATIRIHALTDSGSGQSWSVTNTITNEVVAGTTTGWQWEVEVNEYVCVDATQCYSVVVNDEDGMSSPAYVEILYNGVQVAGSTNGGSFTGPSLVADRFSPACQSSENDIITFSVPDMLSVDIDNEHHTVTAEISYASTENLSAIVPTITVSEYAEITLVGDVAYVAGNAQDFTNPVVYTVVAENGTPQTWNVIVTRSTVASSEKDIIDFTFVGQVGESVIDPTEHTVTAFASWNISLEDPITPTIEVSPMATINPESGVAQNFSAPVTYTVTAEDESTQEWIVTITQDSSTMASLPYTCNFEDATENANWVLENGNELNNWYIGAATNHGGANGLYISDDNGASYHYNTTDGTYSDEDRGSYVYAYRQINVAETGRYDISFDWLANGEGSYDLLRAFAVPLTSGSTLVAGNANGMTSYTNTNPTGWIDIANPTGILNQQTEWQTSDATIELNAGAYNLVFFWKNDYSGGSQTPAAVDNVSIARSTFTITASAEGLGSITPVGDTVVADGATVVFTMTPMSGFALSALTVDGVDQLSQVVNNTYTFENVSADHTIVATFEPAIIINATAGNGGSISPAGEVSVGAHSNATFTITAGEGYIISSVLVDNEEVLNDNTVRTTYNYTFTNVTASHTIAASFVAAEPHYITATAGNGGSISPSGRVEVAYNGSQTFEFTPDEGYSLANIVVDNGPATAENNTYTFTNVIDDHTINANFTVNSYNLTIHYVFADDSEASADYTAQVVYGTPYSVESPVIAGYTADQTTVAGTMPAEDVTVTVRYTANNYNLTIHYVYEDNTEARPDYTAQFAYGAEYSVESPVIECYTANTPVVEGTMPAEDHVVTVTYTVDTYTLTIHYVYADNTAISDSVMQVACGTTYSVESPVIDGYTANPAVVEGTMPAENHEVTVTYNEIVTHTLTIHYVYAETNAQAADDHTEILAEGAAYSVPSPVIDGYTADQTVVAGTMGTADITVTVTYTENAPVTHTLTIHYVYAETNAQAAADYTATLAAGESYSVASPVIAGYTADQATVAGTMPAQDVEVTVTYTANTPETYTLTIHYVYADNTTAVADYTATLAAGESYSVASPVIPGYTPDQATVAGTMPAQNVEVTVRYTANSSTTYTIIATAGANGTITPNGVITVNEGATQTFRITPNNGYRIATVMVDDVNVINDVVDFQYTFYNVTADHRINVTFTNGDAVDEYTAGSMSVYPNPNNGMFSIEFANINGDATYQLIDARGAVVETRDINVMNGDTMNFDYNLRPGAYFVRIITSDRVYVEQIVVE
ncbi:MAG: MucBP domain-containing protein, partial [Bacteroidales bacterium]|nr:MucBP domain-containing protein [Bacteroidales bacterium]